MSVDSLELIDLSTLEAPAPPCDYGGWAGECPNAAVWIMRNKPGAKPCCGRPTRPFVLLCQECLDVILQANGFVCRGCGDRVSGEENRRDYRIEKL